LLCCVGYLSWPSTEWDDEYSGHPPSNWGRAHHCHDWYLD